MLVFLSSVSRKGSKAGTEMTIYCVLLYVCSDSVNCNEISLNMTLGVNTGVMLIHKQCR